MKVRETTSVQEHVVLTNIKALDLCVCECMYTHAITHTRSNCLVFSLFSFITYSRQNIMAVGFEAFMFSQSRRKFTNKCFSTEREHINASHHLACHSVCVSAMVKLSLQEVIDHITDQENSEDESYSEDALQDILEEENIAENLATTEEEQSSDFEGPAEVGRNSGRRMEICPGHHLQLRRKADYPEKMS